MTDIDPITLATVWHSFQTLVREMRHMVTRTSQSYLMSQLKDVSVGIWLADGSTVAMPQGLLCQFMGTKYAIRAIKEQFERSRRIGYLRAGAWMFAAALTAFWAYVILLSPAATNAFARWIRFF